MILEINGIEMSILTKKTFLYEVRCGLELETSNMFTAQPH